MLSAYIVLQMYMYAVQGIAPRWFLSLNFVQPERTPASAPASALASGASAFADGALVWVV